MPSPWSSSLPFHPNLQDPPYCSWVQLARSERELVKLVSLFHGMPKAWLEWVERNATLATERGVKIKNPLEYRLTALWNGIILLQEAKFICDWLENGLRQSFLDFATTNRVNYAVLRQSLPERKKLEEQWVRDRRAFDVALPPTEAMIASLTFYQLTELMSRNWATIEQGPPSLPGFSALFKDQKSRHGLDHFRGDMKRIRNARNDIAHSKRLFRQHEVQKLYDVGCRWLVPLNVELKDRILAYRSRRPRFLEDLV